MKIYIDVISTEWIKIFFTYDLLIKTSLNLVNVNLIGKSLHC